MPQCFRYILPLFCCLLLIACSTDDGATTGTTAAQPVMFSAGMTKDSKAPTRAANEINEDGDGLDGSPKALKTIYDGRGFGVFGCYTGLHGYSDSNVKPDFMYNEHITWDDSESNWSYTPIKYWPNGEGLVAGLTGENPHYVSFLAYAPWSDDLKPDPEHNPADYCITSFSKQGEYGNPWLTYRLHRDVSQQVDLLYATQLDKKKPAVAERIPFTFNHALACVGDKVRIKCSDGLQSQIDSRIDGVTTLNAKVEITDFKIEYTLTSKARLVLWSNSTANWQTILSENPICKRTVTYLTAMESIPVYAANDTPEAVTCQNEWPDQGIFYIPAELDGYPQTAKVSLTYRILTYNGSTWSKEAEIKGTATITMHDYNKPVVDESILDNPDAPGYPSYPDAYEPGKHLYINVELSPMDISLTGSIAPWVEHEYEIEGIED